MITATARFSFSAGHRVLGPGNRCQFLHGHNYEVTVIAHGQQLDKMGRLKDFDRLKEALAVWIDTNWQGGMILCTTDEPALEAMKAIDNQKIFLTPFAPTAEQLALHLLECVCPTVIPGDHIRVGSVTVAETQLSSGGAHL